MNSKDPQNYKEKVEQLTSINIAIQKAILGGKHGLAGTLSDNFDRVSKIEFKD